MGSENARTWVKAIPPCLRRTGETHCGHGHDCISELPVLGGKRFRPGKRFRRVLNPASTCGKAVTVGPRTAGAWVKARPRCPRLFLTLASTWSKNVGRVSECSSTCRKTFSAPKLEDMKLGRNET